MALILCLETATQVCSVALCRDGEVIALRENKDHNAHSALITLFIEEVMQESGHPLDRLDAIAVSKGPGSYTGLRIGVSTAKGLCYALNKPLIAIETLEAAAHHFANGQLHSTENLPQLIAPMIDARRMEVYTALFDRQGTRLTDTSAQIIEENYFDNHSGELIALIGDGAPKFEELFREKEGIKVVSDFLFSAAHLAPLAEQRFQAGQFENLAYFEPFYFKAFIAGKPRVKGLYE